MCLEKSERSALAQFARHSSERRKKKTSVLKTRWSMLDECLLGGFDRDMLVTIAGRTGTGKSAVAGMLVEDFLGDDNAESNPLVIHMSFEMSTNRLMLRNMMSKARLTSHKIMGQVEMTQEECLRLEKCLYEMSTQNRPCVYITDPQTVSKIYEIISKKQEENPDRTIIVVLDHTSLVAGMEDTRTIIKDLQKCFINLRQHGKTLIIQLSQMNREIEMAMGLRAPRLSDISESDSIAHASDVVIMLDRPDDRGIKIMQGEYEDPNADDLHKRALQTAGRMFMYITKNRDGQNALICFAHNFKYMDMKQERILRKW